MPDILFCRALCCYLGEEFLLTIWLDQENFQALVTRAESYLLHSLCLLYVLTSLCLVLLTSKILWLQKIHVKALYYFQLHSVTWISFRAPYFITSVPFKYSTWLPSTQWKGVVHRSLTDLFSCCLTLFNIPGLVPCCAPPQLLLSPCRHVQF